MDFLRRHLFDLLVMPFTIWLQWNLVRRLAPIVPQPWRPLVRIAGVLATGVLLATFLVSLPVVSGRLHYWPALEWFKAAGLFWAIASTAGWTIDFAWRRLSRLGLTVHDPGRRRALEVCRAAAVSLPAAMLGYGAFIERHHFRLVEAKIRVPGLPAGLNGLRLVQLTDIHFGSFFSPRDLRYSIEMANGVKAHLALVTGDLISVYSDPLDECLNLLRGLKAEAGVVGCLGNHEIVAQCEDYAALRGGETGIRFLRDKALRLRFGDADLNIAGVDYQPKDLPYLPKAAGLIRPGQFNVLMSHNPDVFPVAARQGWDLTVAGHTHGGQIAVEILGMSANIARFYTPYVYGHYERDGRQIYVSRGLGTVGVPTRVGAPPEVSVLTLCAT